MKNSERAPVGWKKQTTGAYWEKVKKERRMKGLARIALVCACMAGHAEDRVISPSPGLLDAIRTVESCGDHSRVGAKGERGAYQLLPSYVMDVNRVFRTAYVWETMTESQQRECVVLYLEHWGLVYAKKTGSNPTDEVFARIHNGGPVGWKKQTTEAYWEKVKKEVAK